MPRTPAALRARRLLAILHLLERDTELPLSAIAETIGATPEETATDLELLSCCGVGVLEDRLVPLYIEDDEATVVVFGDLPALDRAVRLSGTEAQALAAALQAAGYPVDDPMTLKLLTAASPEVEAEEIGRVVRAAASPAGDTLRTVSLALENRNPLTIVYHGVGRDEGTERVIEPLVLLNDRGSWYLEAFCRTAGSLRTFRVDRIREARIVEERAEERELSPVGAAFTAQGLPLARIRLAPGEEVSDREWPGVRIVEHASDASLVVEVPYSGTGWISRQVVARLGAAEVIAPDEVREAVARLADR